MRLNIPNLPGALCATNEPEFWFPDKGHSTLPAKKVCMACSVRLACLQWALDHNELHFGVWGALGPEERQELMKRRAA